jgi:hypothetical protein
MACKSDRLSTNFRHAAAGVDSYEGLRSNAGRYGEKTGAGHQITTGGSPFALPRK